MTGQTLVLESGVTVADNYGISFTDPEMKSFKGTFLDGYTGVVIDFSKDNLAINADNFPDENFRVFLQSQSYGKDYVLTPEEISSIKSLYVINNGITSLKGIEYFTALTELVCYENQLTSLDVSKNTALTEFYCSLNQIKGAQAEALVNSLPKVTDGKLYFCDPTDAAEKNEITDAQVAKAKAKGWTVMAWNGSGWSEYAGTTGIGNVEQAEPGAVRTYTLDGRPVGGQPAKPGIYIRNGKKIMVK